MKKLFASLIAVSALTLYSQAADVSAKITDVHICCQSCVKGVQKAIATVPGASAAVSQEDETVTLTGPDTDTVQKGADALVAAGYYGKSDNDSIKINAEAGAKNVKVQSLKIKGVHLCCGKCVKAVNEALSGVQGVQGNTAAKGAKSFEVTGDFNDKDVFDALQKAGLTGTEE